MTTQVEYRRLGKTGLRVSNPMLGGMSFGSVEWSGPWMLEEEKAFEVLKAAWDKGINTIDTANIYSNGISERIIGNFIKKYQIPRSEFVIATNCYHVVAKTPGTSTVLQPQPQDELDYDYQAAGLSRAAIFNAVDASLERLRTSYIDILQVHGYDLKTKPEETMEALHDLVESGKVRYIGASSMRTWQFALLNEIAEKRGWTKFVSMQPEYSLLYREEEREMLAYCKYNGIGVIPWAPLAGGDLCRPLGAQTPRRKVRKGTPFDKKYTEADKIIISRVEEISKKHGKKMSQVALAWVSSKITSPIVGANSVTKLEESLIQGFELTEDEVKYLEEPYVPKPVRAHAQATLGAAATLRGAKFKWMHCLLSRWNVGVSNDQIRHSSSPKVNA
ncbi:Aldo/keto reductase [Pluteus cervinus]|uniref:Aldo/keto reductase n=1 Tax=Pluteus cervinus TaxID=181527 RepID=A0ACD3AES9_9AGAR|nr:Aldo/keto reductase [Pluteus cervinus]